MGFTVQPAGMKVVVHPDLQSTPSLNEKILYRMVGALLGQMGGSVVIEDKALVLMDPEKSVYCEAVVGGTKVSLK